ncbi:MAG: response regulator transcription factor [Pseudomonadota bacterium]|nr:response regulator transcription factor [Pseudomonadota bacterium]
MHFFLTADGRIQPRWREAFPDAVAGVAATAELLAAAAVVWLSEGHPRHSALLAELRQSGRPFVVISPTPRQEAALAALAAGARGYCHALATPEMLRDVAAAVSHGGLWVGPELMSRLIQSLPSQALSATWDGDLAPLTERERETAQHVAQGLSNKEIARRLDITERTVKAHLSAIFAKLGLRDRLQLALRFKAGGKP